MDWTPAQATSRARGAQLEAEQRRSSRRSTARGATDERATLLAQSLRRSSSSELGSRVARASASASSRRAPRSCPRGSTPPRAAAAAGRLALARRARRLPPAGREHRPVRRAARRRSCRACPGATRPRCRSARSAYGLVVESHEGRPTKIEGNELHPATAGASSARMQAAILGLYDPDRSQHACSQRRRRPPSLGRFRRGLGRAREDATSPTAAPGSPLLAPPSSSPTLARLARRAPRALPAARWRDLRAGLATRTRSPASRGRRPAARSRSYHLDKARGDPRARRRPAAAASPKRPRTARGFAAGRRARRPTATR